MKVKIFYTVDNIQDSDDPDNLKQQPRTLKYKEYHDIEMIDLSLDSMHFRLKIQDSENIITYPLSNIVSINTTSEDDYERK